MSGHNYADQSMSSTGRTNSPEALVNNLSDIDNTLVRSVGLYSKEEIEEAKFSRFSRFGRVLDLSGHVQPGREYLFFVKPDLHICVPCHRSDIIYKWSYDISKRQIPIPTKSSSVGGPLVINPQLQNNQYFSRLCETNPDVISQLQYSVSDNPFACLLSFYVNSFLSLDSSTSKTMETPATIYGTNYNYLQDSEDSDEMYSFNLEFMDNKFLDVYHFFKAYNEYHIARKSGLVTPPSLDYYKYKRLHNTMGIYKFIVAEDMETILYWAYFWGVIPTSCPREAFQDPSFSQGLTFSVSFEAAFIEDMNPRILMQFNKLMLEIIDNKAIDTNKNVLPIVKQNYDARMRGYDPSLGSSIEYPTMVNDIIDKQTNFAKYTPDKLQRPLSSIIDGRLPIAALVHDKKVTGDSYTSSSATKDNISARNNGDSRRKYRLKWYAPSDILDEITLPENATFDNVFN